MLTVADEKGGQLDKRVMIYADEIGTLPKIDGLEMMFSASHSRKISIVAIADGTAHSDYNSNIALAIGIYPQIIDGPYIKDKIKGFISTRRKNVPVKYP